MTRRFVSIDSLGNHSVDAVLTGGVSTGEEKLEVQPSTEADDHRIGHITRSSVISIGEQFATCVHGVDTVVAGYIRTGEEKLEVQPSTEADDHRIGHIAESSGVRIG